MMGFENSRRSYSSMLIYEDEERNLTGLELSNRVDSRRSALQFFHQRPNALGAFQSSDPLFQTARLLFSPLRSYQAVEFFLEIFPFHRFVPDLVLHNLPITGSDVYDSMAPGLQILPILSSHKADALSHLLYGRCLDRGSVVKLIKVQSAI